jgi:manganese transport system ATP-binding protein
MRELRVSAAVKAVDLVASYGSTVALSRSSFELPKGLVTAVIGPNGSGKSTLLNIIAGLMAPTSGSIEVGDVTRGRTAYVLQTTKVNDALPISVKEVVTMGRYARTGAYRWIDKIDKEAVDAAMQRTGIADIADRPLSDLSGGQRQRAFVAQGLAQDHDLLLLDEPLTGIDLPTAQAIDLVIHDELERGCTVVMTTHDLSEAQVADYVVLLSGRVVASGTPTEVITAANLRLAYGSALMHVEDGRIFLDDAAHSPVDGRHLHRERTIHTETSQTHMHGED